MKRSLVVLLATSLVLVGCGNDSPSSTDTKSPKTTETKQQKAEQAVLDVYQTYEKTLGQSGRADAKDLASIEYTGDEKQLEPLAVGAKNLNVVPVRSSSRSKRATSPISSTNSRMQKDRFSRTEDRNVIEERR